ncbi:hypothetical protein TrispH2_012110 [Trichoplax sp. H2]|nr:hypothetical protein TrispH2_012110 [Trichoplax sp. H2]|eukprot:RDD36215.1 hypothetical protein TrispH2_012110 [Trichoplax sp. H2]
MKSNNNLKHWILCIHFIAFIWLLATCRCESTETSSGCPSFCNCSTLSINCSSGDLIELPNINYTDVRYVTSLIINNTSIRRIRARSFIYYPELVVL